MASTVNTSLAVAEWGIRPNRKRYVITKAVTSKHDRLIAHVVRQLGTDKDVEMDHKPSCDYYKEATGGPCIVYTLKGNAKVREDIGIVTGHVAKFEPIV